MKSKKLLILIASLAAVVVIIVILASVFSIKKADNIQLVYYDFSSAPIPAVSVEDGGLAPNDILKMVKGKSSIFLSKDKLMDQMNTTYTNWHVFDVRKYFPNIIEIHILQRTPILKVNVGGEEVYIDNFGYVANAPENARIIDATSAFNGTDALPFQVGRKFEFAMSENNERLECVIEALKATWQCRIDAENLAAILGDDNVFTFDKNGSGGTMYIKPSSGGTIRILSPKQNLTERLKDAYSVYYNSEANLQDPDWVITVRPDGTITTPDPDKK